MHSRIPAHVEHADRVGAHKPPLAAGVHRGVLGVDDLHVGRRTGSSASEGSNQSLEMKRGVNQVPEEATAPSR